MKTFILLALVFLTATGYAQVDAPPVISHETPVTENSEDTIYNTAGIEVKPDYPGGIKNFYTYLATNIRTPDHPDAHGKVFASFVVEKDGSLSEITIMRDFGYGSGEEVVRVLKASPNWIPGEQNGKKVRVRYAVPIVFQAKK